MIGQIQKKLAIVLHSHGWFLQARSHLYMYIVENHSYVLYT